MQSLFPQSFTRLREDADGLSERGLYLTDDEIIWHARRLDVEICWEFHLSKYGGLFAQHGFAVEGKFTYDWRHTVYRPFILNGDPDSFGRSFEVWKHSREGHLVDRERYRGAHLEFDKVEEFQHLPMDVKRALREKVISFFGDTNRMPGLFKRRTPKSRYARPITK